uniref:ThiF domain-containing protein n=1 Tax=Steinernema glaseri TaxID=37863 RepID=A0A1I7YSW6_9BILA
MPNRTPARSRLRCDTGEPVTITSDEAELYDRQIRLWGLEAQNRLRNSNVLIFGVTNLGIEIAKNLILCGLKSVMIMDQEDLTEEDLEWNFLAQAKYVGKNRAFASLDKARDLNPMVYVDAALGNIVEQETDFYKRFDLIILVDQKHSVNARVDDICREYSIRFQASGVFGWTGYAFSDFNGFEYLVKKPAKLASTVETTLDVDMVDIDAPSNSKACPSAVVLDITEEPEDLMEKKAVPYVSYSAAFDVEWELLKKYTRQMKRAVPQSLFPIRALLTFWDKASAAEPLDVEELATIWKKEVERCQQDPSKHLIQPEKFEFFSNPQLTSACAVVGGLAAQETIKALSQNERPLKNVFIYSALDSTSFVCDFPPRR